MDTTSTPPNHDGENVVPNQISGVGESSPDQNKSEPTSPPPPQQASQTPSMSSGAGPFFRSHRRSRVVLGSRGDLASVNMTQVFMPLPPQLPSASNAAPEGPEEKEETEEKEEREEEKKKKKKKVRFDFDEPEEDVFAEWLSELQGL
ncbi:hypothetical protein TWF594_005792 [Orbilia oligospora]|nr:hypothetical protein TWF706_006696 [Orbilia oligospora]KAF3152037.1 hypothetical protein TWF594_005792 [Orbilia oligospora]